MSTSFEDMDRDLGEANSHLRALLDFTNSPATSPLWSPSALSRDPLDESRQVKRRKLDADRNGQAYRWFRYGKYGQVEPGQLTMGIASCDGGLYSNEALYAAENILKDDASVYCTKGSRCNIVLQHQGATVFSLQELVIKAPGSNYTAPVREGMVFVAMDSDDLLSRTAQYQIQYLPSRVLEGRQSGQGARGTPAVYSIRHGHDGNGNIVTVLHPRQPHRHHAAMDEDGDDESGRVALIPPEFTVTPPPFNITTECSEDESEAEITVGRVGFRRRRRRPPPNHIGTLPFESDSSDEGGDLWDTAGSAWATFDGLARSHNNRERESSGPTLAEARETAQLATQDAVRAVGGGLMTPLAHFHIDKDQNKCTIKFDPPVSGRFILLKMWSPHHDPSANIDIQGVIAKGFAGPRYVPAVELR